jgi:hypothetical protein
MHHRNMHCVYMKQPATRQDNFLPLDPSKPTMVPARGPWKATDSLSAFFTSESSVDLCAVYGSWKRYWKFPSFHFYHTGRCRTALYFPMFYSGPE